jgi:hydrogenase expression/formation protein HypE
MRRVPPLREDGVSDGNEPDFAGSSCPIPIADYPTIQLAHGGGGRLTKMLIETIFVPQFANAALDELHDGALLEVGGARVAFSTDSFVVRPIFFPGGDIGSLAINGTVNDLAMCGARPLGLSAGFILEEGLPMEDLWRIAGSMKHAATRAGVSIVTGDTKVVDRGKGDGVYINTAGIGLVPPGITISPKRARPGDIVILSGSMAVHGIAIMSVREGLEFGTQLTSDTAPLSGMVDTLLTELGLRVHVLRDPTRGGVASTLNELAVSGRVGVVLDERSLPVREEVLGACEILGLDPLYVANEGIFLAFVERDAAEEALAILRADPLGGGAVIVGEVVADHPGTVWLKSRIGGTRVVDLLTGEQLPRIC